jgi:hypothetical protein
MATTAKTAARPTAAKKSPAGKKAPATRAASPADTRFREPAAGAADKSPKTDKAKKPKLVRDSFTIPKTEYAVLEALKERAAKAGAPSKKSEVLRAGIKALAGLPDAAFLAAMGAVPSIKTGRPAKG